MPAGTVLVIVIGCVLVAAAAGVATALELRLMLTRRQFGQEYDRLAGKMGHRRARAQLIGRRRRVADLGIRPLDAGVRQELASSWAVTQEAFVEDPPGAVQAARDLVLRTAKERGYLVDDREQLRADLSVHHARRLDSYRRAEETTAALASGSVPTEELRQALLWYRAMFRELAESPEATRSGRPGQGNESLPAQLQLPRLRGPRGQIPQPHRSRMPRLTRTPAPSQREGANQA
jgi:hypothetical protein